MADPDRLHSSRCGSGHAPVSGAHRRTTGQRRTTAGSSHIAGKDRTAQHSAGIAGTAGTVGKTEPFAAITQAPRWTGRHTDRADVESQPGTGPARPVEQRRIGDHGAAILRPAQRRGGRSAQRRPLAMPPAPHLIHCRSGHRLPRHARLRRVRADFERRRSVRLAVLPLIAVLVIRGRALAFQIGLGEAHGPDRIARLAARNGARDRPKSCELIGTQHPW